MGADTANTGGVGPIVEDVLPKQPRRVVLVTRTLAEEPGAPLVFVYVEINSYLVGWKFKAGIDGNTRPPRVLDQQLPEDVHGILPLLDSAMAGTRIPWPLRFVAGDAGMLLVGLGGELHARMIVVGMVSLEISDSGPS